MVGVSPPTSQADAPDEYKTYLHRSGRTGRAGRSGTVVTLITRQRQRRMTELLDVLTPLRRPRPVTGPLLLLTAPVEERAEQVAQPAEVAKVLEGKALLVDGARTRARRAPTEALSVRASR